MKNTFQNCANIKAAAYQVAQLCYAFALFPLLFSFINIPLGLNAQTPKDNDEVFLKHLYSGKYLCSDKKVNGENFWMWGPIPEGHVERYIFITEPAGAGKYYLKHKYSGKYLCSDKKENMGNVWMWGPMPKGHEARYAFQFENVGSNRYYIKHVYSGKYLCSGDRDNHGKFWLYGPIPEGHEWRYTFELIRTFSLVPNDTYSTSGDLVAFDWCYRLGSNQGGQTITFYPIMKNDFWLENWRSQVEGDYAIGAYIGSELNERKHILLAYPYWFLDRGTTAILDGGVTLPFHQNNEYMFAGWTFHHQQDTNSKNNFLDGPKTYYKGSDFLPGGAVYQMKKQCFQN